MNILCPDIFNCICQKSLLPQKGLKSFLQSEDYRILYFVLPAEITHTLQIMKKDLVNIGKGMTGLRWH
jgi:hypothetical protein